MATFSNNTFIKDDDYETPKHIFEQIAPFIPKDKIIWEAFYCNGKAGTYLQDLGFNVIHKPVDFFENNLGDIIVSNPPFSLVKHIMPRLFELDKPFMLIMPISNLSCKYMDIFKDNLQIIRLSGRTNFLKNGKLTKNVNFVCCWICYKMNLEKDILWI